MSYAGEFQGDCDDALAHMVAAGHRHLKVVGTTEEPKFYLSLILIDLNVNSHL